MAASLETRLQVLERRANDSGSTGRISMTADELKAHFQKWLGYLPDAAELHRLATSPPADLTTEELRALARIRVDGED